MKLPIRKKAQVQTMETIAILFIFFILVFVGIVFYSNIMKSKFQETKVEYEELSKLQVVQIISSLPEIQCSQDNIVEPNCIDLLKFQAATHILKMSDYFDFFGFSKITVEEVFPNNNEYILYDKQPDKINQKLASYFPISLFDAKHQSYSFGVLIVEVYK